jgi:type VI secretion system secreted protein VgrG
MADTYDQSKRLLKITTTLGADQAQLNELDGIDEISQPFVFSIRFVTRKPAADVKALLGTEATIEFGTEGSDTGRRKFRGSFRRVTRTARATIDIGQETEWQAELVPKLWFLSRRSNLRIHHHVTLSDIITTIFGEHGLQAPTVSAMKFVGQVLDYCVQYRESDLDFLARMMEKFGWFYFHKQEAGATSLVIADANAHATAWSGAAPTMYDRSAGSTVWTMEEEFSVQSGQWMTRDFDAQVYEHQEHTRPTKFASALKTGHEVYDYPGAYFVASQTPGDAALQPGGKEFTDIGMEREEALHHLRRGTSDIATLDAGKRLKYSGVDVTGDEVLITRVRHRAQDYSHWSDADWGSREQRPPSYDNEFLCLPQTIQFRPQRLTPRPFVRGVQTAKVTVGGTDTDALGRVKVLFHWDRAGGDSCWVRVAQGWAGGTFGHIQVPRVDEEVIVDFLDGDPDRPLITGRVYNGVNTVPYALPGNATQSGFKTQSYDASGNNELRFEDKAGEEHIYVHAQKDLNTEVENNETRKVGLDGTGDRTTTIKNDDKLTVTEGNLETRSARATTPPRSPRATSRSRSRRATSPPRPPPPPSPSRRRTPSRSRSAPTRWSSASRV